MSEVQYSLINNGGTKNITVFYRGEMYAAVDTHPNWAAIVEGCFNEDPQVIALFDIGATANARFERLSDRVSIRSGVVHFDNKQMDNALSTQISRFVSSGVEDFNPLIEFMEKIETNPNEHSREQLFDWLNANDFTILPNGNFVGYKGVRVVDGQYESINHGSAISNGVEYNGAIPNPLGAIVEMPRDAVEHDPSVGCHQGLHVGTWDYARSFAQGAVLKIEVNPRDVVSVPTDCGSQKLRACRYTVLEVIDTPVAGPLDYDPLDYMYDDDEDVSVEAEEHYYNEQAVKSEPVVNTMAGSVDTRLNHTRQKRDQYGRFIPKS